MFFQQQISLRLTKKQAEKISELVKSGKYDNVSHFARCAINKLITSEYLKEVRKCKKEIRATQEAEATPAIEGYKSGINT